MSDDLFPPALWECMDCGEEFEDYPDSPDLPPEAFRTEVINGQRVMAGYICKSCMEKPRE